MPYIWKQTKGKTYSPIIMIPWRFLLAQISEYSDNIHFDTIYWKLQKIDQKGIWPITEDQHWGNINQILQIKIANWIKKWWFEVKFSKYIHIKASSLMRQGRILKKENLLRKNKKFKPWRKIKGSGCWRIKFI